jgi:hypothetical protein
MMAMARLRALRTHLLPLHRALIEFERSRYERAHGRIEGAHEVLRLVMHDPWFQWLRPLAAVIVQIDERLADDRTVNDTEVESFRTQAARLLRGDADAFRESYQRALQESPDIVVAHGKVIAFIEELRPAP